MSHVDADTEALVANLDLILKWMTLRLFSTTPSAPDRDAPAASS